MYYYDELQRIANSDNILVRNHRAASYSRHVDERRDKINNGPIYKFLAALMFTFVLYLFLCLFGLDVSAATTDEVAVFNQVNAVRVEQGLIPLTWNDSLEVSADVRALEQSVLFSHTRPDGSEWWTVDEINAYGENLAKDLTSAEVVAAWVSSPTHYANIVADFTSGAIGSYVAPNGTLYYVQLFGY